MVKKEASVTENRDKYIGGSDIPIIFGISPFKTRWELLLEKAEPKAHFHEIITTPEIEYGNEMEANIRDYINESKKSEFKPDVKIVGDLRGNVDGMYEDTILEIKTTSVIHDKLQDYKTYLLQLVFYMNLYGKENGLLAVYERPEDFSLEMNPLRLQLFDIKLSDYAEMIESIEFQLERFRADIEKVKSDPFLTEQDLQPKELITLANNTLSIANEYEAYKELEAQFKEVKAKLKTAMESCGIKRWIMNDGTKITLVEDGADTVIDKFDEATFKKENKEVYSRYCKPTIKAGRSGYVKITLPKEK